MPQTLTGRAYADFIEEYLMLDGTSPGRKTIDAKFDAIEAEAAAMERKRLRKEWDRLMDASDWPFDAATFTVEFYKSLADPTP